jgi:class 3 adenylate cyclase
MPLDGRNHALLSDVDVPVIEVVTKAMEEFVGEGEETAPVPGLAAEDIHTILFTDVEGSTAMTQRLGDAKAREVLREHERITREALKSHGGAEVKTMGDGFMASFGSATKALECAVAIQRAFEERNAGVGAALAPPQGAASGAPTEAIRVRIGLNAGEPVAEDEDLFGTAVQLAARVCARAEPGQVLAANVVRELAMGKGFLFADLGEVVLRGFEDPVRLYEVRTG